MHSGWHLSMEQLDADAVCLARGKNSIVPPEPLCQRNQAWIDIRVSPGCQTDSRLKGRRVIRKTWLQNQEGDRASGKEIFRVGPARHADGWRTKCCQQEKNREEEGVIGSGVQF